MEYGELYIPPIRKYVNPLNGQFLKGHEPANKGKTWNEFMGKRAQRRAAKGWANLDKYRHKKRSDVAGRTALQVIAINDNGTFKVYKSISDAGRILAIKRENVQRCCNINHKHPPSKKNGRINTDHKYMGIRFYYENDADIWMGKINKQ